MAIGEKHKIASLSPLNRQSPHSTYLIPSIGRTLTHYCDAGAETHSASD